MPKTAAHGRIVWHDLLTTDHAAARSFYTQVAPWKTQPWEDAKDYEMWTLNGEPIGGVTNIGPEMAAAGVRPHWLAYVCVYDVDACARQAVSLGGKLRSGPKEVPHVGCWAVISDPQGATIGIFEPADTPPGHDGDPAIGEFSWHELATDDYKAAREFYRVLFRWETMQDYDMGELGIYSMFGQHGQMYGGMFTRPAQIPVSNWLCYVRVPTVKPVADEVARLGGSVMNGPMEVPGGDWVAQCMDPQGAAFALHAKAG
jgi:predicted enzyme related to lactoylglutathione lyase